MTKQELNKDLLNFYWVVCGFHSTSIELLPTSAHDNLNPSLCSVQTISDPPHKFRKIKFHKIFLLKHSNLTVLIQL